MKTKYKIQLSNIYASKKEVFEYEWKYKVAGYLRLSQEDGDKDVSDSIVSQKI